MRRTSTARRDLGFPVRASANGEADISAFRADVEQGRVKALYVFDPGPDGYIGDVSWIIDAKQIRTPAAARRARRADDRARSGGRHRAAGRILGREGRSLRQRTGPAAGGVACHRTSRASAQEDWQVFVNVGPGARAPPLTYTSSAAVRADLAAAFTATRDMQGSARSHSRVRCRRATGCRRRTRPSDGSGTSCSRILPPVKFAGTPRATLPENLIPLQKVD